MQEEDLGFFFRISIYVRQLLIFFRTLIYLKNPRLFFSQLFTLIIYFFRSPYRMLNKNINPYGETPYFTLDKMAKNFGVLSTDTVLDLGCGRGLGVFFWSEQVKAQSYGIDNHAMFILRANRIKKVLNIKKAHLIEGDFFEYPLEKMTVIYLYGTALSDEAIEKMIQRFIQLSTSPKIITVTYPLSEFSSKFVTENQFTGFFPWGRSEVYLNRKIST